MTATNLRDLPKGMWYLCLILVLAISACGGNGDEDDPGQEEPSETTVAQASESTAATEETDTTAGSGDTRTIEHFLGTAEVPVDPQRVVVLDPSMVLETTLRLDVPVIATRYRPEGEAIIPYIAEEYGEAATGLEDVGWTELDFEKIVSLEPDLIIANHGHVDEELYGKLEPIAPTVVIESVGGTPWKDPIREVAAVFGKEDQIEAEIADFEARADEIEGELADTVGDMEISMVNFRALDDIRMYHSQWCAGQTLQEVGLTQIESQISDDPVETSTQLGVERLIDVDGDILLYFVGSTSSSAEEAEATVAEIQAHPLWEQLEAVQNERAYEVESDHWFTCVSLPAQHLVLDDLERLLTQG